MPLWMYPNIVERLRGTPARMEEVIRDLPEHSLTNRINESWSIQENIGHLWDLERLWYGRFEDFENGEEMLRPADLENHLTHESNHNEKDLDDFLARFRTERMQLVAKLTDADASFRGVTSLHPRLEQPMRVIDLAFFIAEHDDHHLARISELIRSRP
ncbi:MAG: hypothetical protein BMS9Abin05_2450 [Rhodothermia bacterium]|nr:MAG: hypothetical protein BMS9Abin05_2450 [Rhodothermia bacterium]